MMTLAQIQKALEGENIKALARELNLSHTTLHHLKSGTNDNPRLKTMEVLSNYFDGKGKE